MSKFRFILGKRALILFLALLVATGAFLGAPAATRTLAESPPAGSQEVSAASADPVAVEKPLLEPSGHSSNLPGGSGDELLQFTSDGHVLDFSEDGIIVALASHMLKTEFLNANAVVPEADGAVSGEEGTSMALPLGRVTYRNLWEGVTLVYEASEASIVKSSYYLDDGMAAQFIRLRYNRPVSLDGQGSLVIAFDTGTMVEAAPVAWQEINGQRKPVSVAYRLYGESEVGFSLGDDLPGLPVIIDPILTWNTFLGGDGTDHGNGIAVDSDGNVYVGGYSNATWGSPVRDFAGGTDAFAAKLTPTGTLVWNTFLGGSGTDYGYAIAVDGSGNVYVGGTSDADWGSPVRAYTSGFDAFAAKLTPTGALTWNTFLGGDSTDWGFGIAVDGSGNVYVSGTSNATWMGMSAPVRAYYGSGTDAFAAKLTSTGALVWNTFLGGSGTDNGRGIAVDGSGYIYVGGYSDATWSETSSPVRAYTSGSDAFAAKLTPTGTLTWNTFLGGSGTDQGYGIAVDSSGNVYVGGRSYATWSGTSSPVRAYTSGYDAFAAKLTPTGALTWNTFLGGSGMDKGRGIAVDGSGYIYVGGDSDATWSGTSSPVRAYTSGYDAFAVKLNDKISITSPAAGATWVVGQTASITWTSTDLTGTCTVELSRDGGSSWTETLTTNTPTQGTFDWTVTGTAGAGYVVCVTGMSADGTTVTGTSGAFTITHAVLPNSVVLTPATATIVTGASTTYTLIAHDTSTNTWDVTASATYTISSGAEGTWTSTNVYNSAKAGLWTVTASYGGKSTTATLEVTHSNTVDHVVLTPSTATILAGASQTYTLIAHDTETNTWDVTSSGTYSIDPGAGGTWTNTYTYNSGKAGQWTITATWDSKSATALLTITSSPSIAVTSPTGNERWTIGTNRDITWTSTDLSGTLTILLARDGVDFTETITKELSSALNSFTWTVTGPGAINAKIRVLQDATEGTSPEFTISIPYTYSGTPTTTSDPWLWIDAGTGSGTLWVTPLTPSLTSDPNLDQFIQETGKRSALFFDIGQQGLSGTLTIVLHFNHQLGEETFQLYRWDGAGWINMPGIPPSPNLADHTFTITINASLLSGTPFGLGGDPAAMPGLSPWALAFLSLALLGTGGWWFLRRRRLA